MRFKSTLDDLGSLNFKQNCSVQNIFLKVCFTSHNIIQVLKITKCLVKQVLPV